MVNIKILSSGSRGNAYLIDDGHTPVLLEAGLTWREIQRGLDFKTSEIRFCLISHEHKDHSKAIKEVMKAGIDVYTSHGTINSLKAAGHRLNPITPLKAFTIDTWTILPFETQHDAVEPLGFLLANSAGDKLLFATDTFYVKYKFKGLTHIMVECNYALDILQENVAAGLVDSGLKNRLLSSHFSLYNVKNFLMANDLSKVEEIYLIHLSDNNSDEERFKREVQEITGKVVYVAQQQGGNL